MNRDYTRDELVWLGRALLEEKRVQEIQIICKKTMKQHDDEDVIIMKKGKTYPAKIIDLGDKKIVTFKGETARMYLEDAQDIKRVTGKYFIIL